jgi:DNA-binding NarL/FixJ family response regulator
VVELTAKEWAITKLVASGFINREIAVEIGTTEHVIKNKLRSIYDKLGLWNRTELAMWYVKHTLDNGGMRK